jgi:hypothetical protein
VSRKNQSSERRTVGRESGCRPRAAIVVLPGVGLLSLLWLFGLYALAVGVALIVLALRVRG